MISHGWPFILRDYLHKALQSCPLWSFTFGPHDWVERWPWIKQLISLDPSFSKKLYYCSFISPILWVTANILKVKFCLKGLPNPNPALAHNGCFQFSLWYRRDDTQVLLKKQCVSNQMFTKRESLYAAKERWIKLAKISIIKKYTLLKNNCWIDL